jgi:hypothetical protein
MGKGRGVYRVLVGKPLEKRPMGRPICRREDILRWIFRKWDVGASKELSWLRIETGGGHFGNELSGYIKCGEFLD